MFLDVSREGLPEVLLTSRHLRTTVDTSVCNLLDMSEQLDLYIYNVYSYIEVSRHLAMCQEVPRVAH